MKQALRKVWWVVRVLLGVALLYYVLVTRGQWQAARDFFSNRWLFPALVLLSAFGAGIEALRLGLLCRSQAIRLRLWAGYRLVCVAAFFMVCIPGGTGGDVVKLYYLATENRDKSVEAATVLLVDRAVGMFTLLVVTLGLAAFNLDLVLEQTAIGWLVLAALLLATVLLAGMLLSMSVTVVRAGWFRKFVGMLPLHRFVERVVEALHAFRDHRGALLAAVLWSMVGHAALTMIFVAAGAVLMPGAPAVQICFLALIGMLANALPITPGGLGVGEAAFEALFGLVGRTGGAALILAWRAGMLPMLILGGVLYVLRGRGRMTGEVSDDRATRATTP
jgi:uncharacterized protein (TIRG00374 family)